MLALGITSSTCDLEVANLHTHIPQFLPLPHIVFFDAPLLLSPIYAQPYHGDATASRIIATDRDQDIPTISQPFETGAILLMYLLIQAIIKYNTERSMRENHITEIVLEHERKLLTRETERSTLLLQSMLPEAIIEQLKSGEMPKAEEFKQVTVLFLEVRRKHPRTVEMIQRPGPRRSGCSLFICRPGSFSPHVHPFLPSFSRCPLPHRPQASPVPDVPRVFS